MKAPAADSRVLRFGVFELDLRAGELHKQGHRIRLQDQPLQILQMLVERPGEVILRDELHQKLWPQDTFVDFDHGLNNAINRLREALGDSADSPRFIETLPRRGYRFIAGVEPSQEPAQHGLALVAPSETESALPSATQPVRAPHTLWGWAAVVSVLLVTAGFLLALNVGGLRQRLWHDSVSAHVRSLVVLPLENLSGDPAQEYFADGMTDELTTNLAQISALRVISRTSAMQYKGKRKTLPEIARELNVDAVVEGSVVRSGNRIRITAQLIDAANDQHLWAQDYERDISDVLSLQNEVARDIAGQVQVKLTRQEETQLAARQAVNPAAQEAYLKGRYLLNQTRALANIPRAIEFFQQAIAIDPAYASAYAGLAQAYVQGAGKEFASNEDFERAREFARRAISLDDSQAEAQAVLGRIALWHDGDSAEGEKRLKIAFQLNPNLAQAHEWYAGHLISQNDFGGAALEYRRFYELDPASPRANARLGMVLVFQRKYDEAIVALQKAQELDPNQWMSHSFLGDAYLGKRMFNQAIAEYKTAKRLTGMKETDLSQLDGMSAVAYALSGNKAQAEAVLRRIQKGRYPNLSLTAAEIAAALGDRTTAYQYLDKGCKTANDVCSPDLNSSPAFDPMREDARFKEVLRRARTKG